MILWFTKAKFSLNSVSNLIKKHFLRINGTIQKFLGEFECKIVYLSANLLDIIFAVASKKGFFYKMKSFCYLLLQNDVVLKT